MTIWLTRPYDDSQHMAKDLGEHGIRSAIAPVMHIEPQPVQWPHETPAAIVLTSRHAAHALEKVPTHWRTLPVYCAGPATAQAAARLGFGQVYPASTGVMELLPLLRENHEGARVLYPSGEDIKLDIAPLLQSSGITVERIVAYRAHAVEQLPTSLVESFSKDEIRGVVLGSPRAVRLVHGLLSQYQLTASASKLDLYCLSLDIAAEAARLLGGRQVYACSLPSYDAMMELLLKHAIKAS